MTRFMAQHTGSKALGMAAFALFLMAGILAYGYVAPTFFLGLTPIYLTLLGFVAAIIAVVGYAAGK